MLRLLVVVVGFFFCEEELRDAWGTHLYNSEYCTQDEFAGSVFCSKCFLSSNPYLPPFLRCI